ncbi:MAG: pitrilysin family protein [Nitrospinota bacterium]|nr:pitrilysin family protein [Nitrospinota bacterium]
MNLTEVGKKELKHYEDRLPNGLTVVTIEMPHIHNMEIAMFVRCGLRFETEKNNGISHFLEHMMFRGNKVYPDSILLNREFELIGRDLRASTFTDYTYFGFSPHISKVERSMDLFAGFFTDPTFSGMEIEREIILEEHLEDLNEEGEDVDINNRACTLLYAGTPLAWPTIGTSKTISSISPSMLMDFFKTFYVPGNMVLAGAGPIPNEQFFHYAEKYFSGYSNSNKAISGDHFKTSIVENQNKPQLLFQPDSDSQVQLQACFRSVSYNHPDFYIVSLLTRIFDDGITSRLQRALREDRGLVYSVESRATSLPDIGTIDFDVTTRAEKICEVLKILLNEIKGFVESGPEDDELERVKQRYSFDLDSDLDDPYRQIVRYGFFLLYSEVISAVDEWEIIRNITREDMMRVASQIFIPGKLNVILVGPFEKKMKAEVEKIVAAF